MREMKAEQHPKMYADIQSHYLCSRNLSHHYLVYGSTGLLKRYLLGSGLNLACSVMQMEGVAMDSEEMEVRGLGG